MRLKELLYSMKQLDVRPELPNGVDGVHHDIVFYVTEGISDELLLKRATIAFHKFGDLHVVEQCVCEPEAEEA